MLNNYICLFQKKQIALSLHSLKSWVTVQSHVELICRLVWGVFLNGRGNKSEKIRIHLLHLLLGILLARYRCKLASRAIAASNFEISLTNKFVGEFMCCIGWSYVFWHVISDVISRCKWEQKFCQCGIFFCVNVCYVYKWKKEK